MTQNEKKFPIGVVIATAIITLILAGGIAGMVGWLGPRQAPVEDADSGGHDHSKKELWTCGMHPWILEEEPGDCPICAMKLTPKRDAADESGKPGERVVAYWRAPMNPMEIYDKPGKSAMGMDLVPVYEDELISGVEVKIDPVTRQNMGLRTEKVAKGSLVHTIRTYGHITYDETLTAKVSPKFSGWFEKLYVDFTGRMVEKGEPLFEIYSPDLVAAQEEYLTAFRSRRRNPGNGNRGMLASARRRLSYFDVAEKEIKAIEAADTVKKTVTIRSPFTGVVTQKNAIEGGFVKAGTNVYTISDLSRVWVEAHIFEYELGSISVGQTAEMTLPYIPGKHYSGKVAYVYPYLQQKTRDVVIRLEFENAEMALKPDMYADIRIRTDGGDGMSIPSESIIRSGERNVVFVSAGEGRFIPREVVLGMSLDGGKTHVLSGLAPGEIIVTSGQFLLDSESKLKEAVNKMMEPKAEEKSVDEDDFFDDMEPENNDDSFFDDM